MHYPVLISRLWYNLSAVSKPNICEGGWACQRRMLSHVTWACSARWRRAAVWTRPPSCSTRSWPPGRALSLMHCKDKMPKILNNYSQKRNIGVSVPISTFMCLWANYIYPRWVCLFCWRKYVDRSWEYMNRSQTQECGNWGWGRAIPRKGIYKRNCRCSVFLEKNNMGDSNASNL